MIEIREPAPLGTTRIQNPAYRPTEEITGALCGAPVHLESVYFDLELAFIIEW